MQTIDAVLVAKRYEIVDVAASAGVDDPREVDRASALVHRLLVEAATRTTARAGHATLRMAALRRSR